MIVFLLITYSFIIDWIIICLLIYLFHLIYFKLLLVYFCYVILNKL